MIWGVGVAGAVEGADVFAVAEDADGVAEAEDFGHAVGDVDHGDAAFFEIFDEGEKLLGFAFGEGAGGFVEDQDVGARADGGGDLDHLFLSAVERVCMGWVTSRCDADLGE